ncbi:hypothetical protein B0H11DRAFT_2277531 [Mycena galericulata]|nr:hypothetical protein B0H11DRAFT_2277531 [Mycena galericulata]
MRARVEADRVSYLVLSRHCTDASGVGAATASSPSRAYQARIGTMDAATSSRCRARGPASAGFAPGAVPADLRARDSEEGGRSGLAAHAALGARIRGYAVCAAECGSAMEHSTQCVAVGTAKHGAQDVAAWCAQFTLLANARSADTQMRERDESLRCTLHC